MNPLQKAEAAEQAVTERSQSSNKDNEGLVILQQGERWLRLANPRQIWMAHHPDEVLEVWQAVETAVSATTNQPCYAAGYISYEAAAALDLATHPPGPNDPPLVWFGLYDQITQIAPPGAGIGTYHLGQWQPALSLTAYQTAVAHIKTYIAQGATYQVNFTFPLHTSFQGDPWTLFTDLATAQRAAYMAYIDTGRHVICSASPELFFSRRGESLLARPMKGTAPRGLTLAQDQAQIAWLHQSPKNRAENVMIVDMLRNDMGRIARLGSVQVPHLFAVERYPTLLQMTSTVTAESTAPLPDLLQAMFPCASITGAPKIRTMQIIRELEPAARGVYTGAIGLVGPEQIQFNVAIRTVVVDREQQTAVYGVGSGIVWDSDPVAEYEECRLKTQVLTRRQPPFALLETLLWSPEAGYFLLERHLTRLAASAVYFQYPLHLPDVRQQLTALAAGLTRPMKVRLQLTAQGQVRVEAVDLAGGANAAPLRLGLAAESVTSDTLWLYHKTTQRQLYEAARAARPDCDEVLLWNERGELTEATTANLVLELDGELVTPAADSGLLPGTFRAELLDRGEIVERIVPVAALRQATAVYLINSVRRWQPAIYIENKDTDHYVYC
jgi:para-aminobenzoate synthetase / 4-amino-4-deoxychorismate lyase